MNNMGASNSGLEGTSNSMGGELESTGAHNLPTNRVLDREAHKISPLDLPRTRRKFLAVVGLQIMLLTVSAAPKVFSLVTGTVITLKSTPTDPSDMFRGEFATLQYSGLSRLYPKENFQPGEQVFVLVCQDSQGWSGKRISRNWITAQPGQIVLKGKVKTSWLADDKDCLQIDYGISQLYMPKGRSAQLQDSARDIRVRVAIDRFGNACIKSANVDGHEVYDGTSWLDPYKITN